MATLAVVTLLGGGLTVATPAHAAGGVFYGIDVTAACRDTHNDFHQSAYVANLGNAYSWWCAHHRIGYPYEWWYVGGVDFQKWCSKHYPGSAATVAGDWASRYPAFRWRCRADREIRYVP